ncbi:MAG: cytochrome-c oxidase, cbb3-type subunit I [Candidatus Krumholzibacteriia bacterium]
MAAESRLRTVVYDDDICRAFSLATIVWGAVALLLGVLVASQLSFWQANFGTSWLTFGRLRPLHTNAAIFAFVGNMMFAGIYYSTQRLLKARMANDTLSWINFWGWQLIIVSAAITLPLGLTQGKEYAELIWPIDIAIAVVWVVFAVNMFWTIARRNEPNLYVAIWFYIATIVTIAVLHIVNSLALPTSFTHSYPIWAGVQDALVQWWYGHNAVAFFLTTPILGIMYYFLPKAAERPVYSYRLSVVHFWSLVFIYIWAGPHHLLYTALPDWAQILGMIFSIMLWAPSWGGMLNGLLTLRGAWDKLRTDPVIKFFVVAVTFYGMSTFEGPLLSIKSVSALGHYTDWIIGHVHGGALGWNGFMALGMLYWMVPRLWNTKLYSVKLAETHFWIATVGILMYVVSMWVSGVSQGLFWRALDADGFLKYPDFIEGLVASKAMYHMRLTGGLLYFLSYLLGIYNLAATIHQGTKSRVEIQVPALVKESKAGAGRLITSPPVLFSVVIIVLAVLLGMANLLTSPLVLGLLCVAVAGAGLSFAAGRDRWARWHDLIEQNGLAFTVLVLFAILVGGVVQIIPTVVITNKVPEQVRAYQAEVATAGGEENPALAESSKWMQQPYSPLELAGRDVYVSEGCYVCHSQMIRPLRHEVLRYGEYSRLEESLLDHPFQWGSKRTGPDLARVGGKYANLWHYLHFNDPRSTSPASNMPMYPWLKNQKVDFDVVRGHMQTLAKLGVPYTDADFQAARQNGLSQGQLIADDLKAGSVELAPDSKLAALIAYVQRLGRGPQPLAAPGVATGGR